MAIFFTLLLTMPATYSSAQCVAPSMTFNNPVLIGGSDGQPGAVYRFSNVAPGIDCTIEILGLYGGALLGEIDNTTQGYYDAWQPYVTAGANDTSYLEWNITFKKAGTNTDTVLPCLAITAVDVDGDNDRLKEFINAATPAAYAVDPATTLTVNFDGTYSSATGSITTIPMIDTFHREAMFQMNFKNISSVVYRNGSISTKDDIDVRHTCIYFKPFFFSDLVALPVKIHAFTATPVSGGNQLNWLVSEEKNLSHYTVQKSPDGQSWQPVKLVPAINSGPVLQSYYYTDPEPLPGVTYYRLQQTGPYNEITYSKIIFTGSLSRDQLTVQCPSLFTRQLELRIIAPVTGTYYVSMLSLQGVLLQQKTVTVQPGTNTVTLSLPAAPAGIYAMRVTDNSGRVVHTAKLVRQQ